MRHITYKFNRALTKKEIHYRQKACRRSMYFRQFKLYISILCDEKQVKNHEFSLVELNKVIEIIRKSYKYRNKFWQEYEFERSG